MGSSSRGDTEVFAAALGRPQTGLQGALPALQGLHQLLQLCLGAGAPEQRPTHGATAAGLNLHTVCKKRESRQTTKSCLDRDDVMESGFNVTLIISSSSAKRGAITLVLSEGGETREECTLVQF